MNQKQLKKVASIFNRCFIVITALCYFTVESYLKKAGIVLLGRSSRIINEPFPSFSIILLLLVSIHFYSRKKDPSNYIWHLLFALDMSNYCAYSFTRWIFEVCGIIFCIWKLDFSCDPLCHIRRMEFCSCSL